MAHVLSSCQMASRGKPAKRVAALAKTNLTFMGKAGGRPKGLRLVSVTGKAPGSKINLVRATFQPRSLPQFSEFSA